MFRGVFSGIIAICVAVAVVCMLLGVGVHPALAQTSPSDSQMLAASLDTAKLQWDRSPDQFEVTHYITSCSKVGATAPVEKTVPNPATGVVVATPLKDFLTPGQWTCVVYAVNRVARSGASLPTSPFYTGYAAPPVLNLLLVVQ